MYKESTSWVVRKCQLELINLKFPILGFLGIEKSVLAINSPDKSLRVSTTIFLQISKFSFGISEKIDVMTLNVLS